MADIERQAHAIWKGDLRSGTGNITTDSGALSDEPYSFVTRFEHKPGTNPEELIAAAHAACYSMALSHALKEKGYAPQRIETEATIHLARTEGGFKIAKMDLAVSVQAEGLGQDQLEHIIELADGGCPVSNLLREGLEIALTAQLG